MKLADVKTESDYFRFLIERGTKISGVLLEKRMSGEATGAPPVGLMIVTDNDDKKRYAPDPATWPLVKEAILRHSLGRYSLRQLLKIMTAKGLRSRNGREMGVAAFLYLLKNSEYRRFF